MEFGPQQIGKWLVVMRFALVALGGLFLLLGKLGLFRLPGDMAFGGDNWKVYIPIGTCIALSVILTLVMWLIQFFRR